MDTVLERFAALPLGNICDANGKQGAMDAGIRPVHPHCRLVGYAYTVKGRPGDNVSIHQAMLEAPADSVLVVDMNGFCGGGHFGEIMATACQVHGIRGLVIDGSVRDAEDLEKVGFPVFARGVCPNGTTKYDIGQRGEPVICGGVKVETGDIIVGGRDGVAVVPGNKAKKVLASAETIAEKEKAILVRLQAGATTADIYGFPALKKEGGK